jgi:hypothetical protein
LVGLIKSYYRKGSNQYGNINTELLGEKKELYGDLCR